MAALRLTLTLTVDGAPTGHSPIERNLVSAGATAHTFHDYENVLAGTLKTPVVTAQALVLQSDGNLAMTWDGVALSDLPLLRAGGIFAFVDGTLSLAAVNLKMVGEAATIHGAAVGALG